ncbi:MAG: hypothetical protein ACRCZE_03395 [Candidatus Altimarinota bacterium]
MPQLKEKPDEQQKYRELEGLGDFDRRSEGKQIVFEADEAISKSNDPVEIISIFESARAKIFDLYKGSRFFQRDVDRFEKFLAIITKVTVEPGRKIKLLPNLDSRGSKVDWSELKDEERKEKAVEIFEIAKEKVLECKEKNLLQGIFSEAEKEWEMLYESNDSVRGDLDNLKLELGHLIFKRSEEL